MVLGHWKDWLGEWYSPTILKTTAMGLSMVLRLSHSQSHRSVGALSAQLTQLQWRNIVYERPLLATLHPKIAFELEIFCSRG